MLDQNQKDELFAYAKEKLETVELPEPLIKKLKGIALLSDSLEQAKTSLDLLLTEDFSHVKMKADNAPNTLADWCNEEISLEVSTDFVDMGYYLNQCSFLHKVPSSPVVAAVFR